jgi:hypothetical protein
MTRAKTQSTPSSEASENILNFAPWRLGGIKNLNWIEKISRKIAKHAKENGR